MAIGAFVRLKPKPGAEEELLERLLDVAVDVRTEPGNVMTLVMRDPGEPGHVLMLELFEDDAAIEAHRVAEHSKVKGPAVHAILKEPMSVQWVETAE